MIDKTEPRFPHTVEVSVEYLRALRRAAGLAIDPETAAVKWWHAQTLDPYGDYPSIPDEGDSIGREYFARAPGSEVWINFDDLPQATRDALWQKYRSKLMFPAGVLDVDTEVSPH
jgi:hypothetical protein